MAPKAGHKPVSEAKTPKTHPEWSDYSGKHADNTSRRTRQPSTFSVPALS
jgi:hypothetical protein